MKKTIGIVISLLMVVSLLASCSAGLFDDRYNESTGGSSGGSGALIPGAMPSTLPEPLPMPDSPDYDYSSNYGLKDESGITPISTPSVDEGLAEKIIYTVSADIETVSFDATIDRVHQLLAMNNAFIENSYIGGRNYAQQYHGLQTFRTANFALRVPKDRLNAVTESLGQLGNVTSLRSDATNITAQFTDTQSRLNSLYVQEERLLDMLMRAEIIEDMISLEARLSDVRYQIESISSTLRNWQNQVDYSTVNLYIYEVETFTEIVPVQQRTYFEQIGDGFLSTMKGIGRFFMGLFKWIVISLPVLVILAVIAVATVILVKVSIKKARKKREQTTGNNGRY